MRFPLAWYRRGSGIEGDRKAGACRMLYHAHLDDAIVLTKVLPESFGARKAFGVWLRAAGREW